MYIKEINYILKIQQYASISKAAEEIYISQPALSKFLKNLEQQIGAPLFSRIGNTLIPTHVGNRYLEYAREIADLQDNWNLECVDMLGEARGKFSVTLPPLRSSCIIPDILQKFYQRYPQVQVTITEESSLVKKHWLSSKDIDLVIYSDTEPQLSLIYEDLGKEEVVLIMSPDNPLAEKGIIREDCRHRWLDLELVKDEHFVLNSPDQATGRLAMQLLETAGITPNVLLQTRNTDVSIRMAAAGTALAFAPETYVRNINFEKKPLYFSVGNPKTEITLYVFYQNGRYLPSYVKHFIELAREVMAAAVVDR